MSLPALIVTGASGFVGRHLLDELKDECRIFGIARRSQRECGAPVHPNIAWMQVDVGDREGLARTFREIASAGGARILIHLAAYYDFFGTDHPEYRRTNVEGTKNVLELAKGLGLERFVFASSVAACAFPRPEGAITEATPADGPHVYAWSKRQGEDLIQAHRGSIPSCIVRFGAVYSDWCEYPPLYMFLNTWLGKSWKARILAGKGLTAIPYVHVRDVVSFFRKLFANHRNLAPAETLIASTSGCSSHHLLQYLATRHYFGAPRKAVYLPALVCGAGIVMMNGWGRVVGELPFERPWMRHYIDTELVVDNARTISRLGWSASPRNRIERRVPYMIERLKSDPATWRVRNEAAMRRQPLRPDLRIYKALAPLEDHVISAVNGAIRSSSGDDLKSFRAMDPEELGWFVRLLYRLLLSSVQSSDRMLIQSYLEVTGISRFRAGFTAHEFVSFLDRLKDTILAALATTDELMDLGQELHDRITMPIEFGKDEIEEQYGRFLAGAGAVAQQERRGAGEARAGSPREMLEETIWNCLVQRK